MKQSTVFNVGIDVGLYSVGLVAVQMGADDLPTKLLNSVVMIHDAGVDPEQQKTAITRKATAGVARRTKRLTRTRKQRLQQLDKFLQENDYPLVDLEQFSDPHTPWRIRAKLATRQIPPAELPVAFSIAVRHIARHRGWRNPYSRVESLHELHANSDELNALKERITEYNGLLFEDDATPAEIINEIIGDYKKIRGAEGLLGGKLRQSDNANELHKIAKMQNIDTNFINTLIDKVFASKSPKGQSGKLVGKDELPGQRNKYRAEKAHPAFQKFRIVSIVNNLRIKTDGKERPLNAEETTTIINFLMEVNSDDTVTWNDVASELGIDRHHLTGTAKADIDGERPYANPPTNTTNQRILNSKIKPLIQWWKNANYDEQCALVTLLSNAEVLAEDAPGAKTAEEFFTTLADTDLEKLDKLNLPAGRAAYSADSLERLTKRMLEEHCDLYTARKNEFKVDADWHPSAAPIGEPVGNPAVDRVLKIINRWLLNVEKEWGAPTVINIEHVRDGFASVSQTEKYKNQCKKRYARNQKVVEAMYQDNLISGKVRASDILRYLAVMRQNCSCAYCGKTITYASCQMDHIVPRKGAGSTNTRDNLLATCESCNHSKGNIPFIVWAEKQANPEISLEKAIERIRFWQKEEGFTQKQWRNFKNDVIMRLKKTTEDEEIDNRSLESVAWMAREVRQRIEYHYRDAETKVGAYRGSITAEARKASELEYKTELIDGNKKTRLDRRHHVMDALTVALMNEHVAKILAERSNLRTSQHYRGEINTWKDYRGRTDNAKQQYGKWLNKMNRASVLLNDAFAQDEVPVMENLRLRLGNSKAHDDTIQKLKYKKVGEQWSLSDIDRASTPQLWCALTGCADYDEKIGLPENSERKIQVKGKYFTAQDEVGIFPTGAAAIMIRNGYAEIRNTIHHARVYRIEGKKVSYAMVRVYASDLARYVKDDLFTAPLPAHSISIRTAEPKLKAALKEGTAQYVGWLVTGDEIRLDTSSAKFHSGQIGTLLATYPVTSFRVTGFPENSRLRLRPALLAGEGLKEDAPKDVQKILNDAGWRPAINVLFSEGSPQIIRRNALGQIRWNSNKGLPTSWQA